MREAPFLLRDLPLGGRLALALLLLVNLGGFVASGLHMQGHYENRDERPGMSLDDIQGAYHGVRSRAPLLEAIEVEHPGELEGGKPLAEKQRRTLLDWLAGSRLSEDYDNLDLGQNAPAEILAASCVSCHSRNATDAAAKKLPLDYWDDVKKLAISREIAPTDLKILIASTHTHAIALATTTIVLALLMFLTGWPGALRGGLPLLAALGLSVDLAAWWLARDSAGFVYAIVAGGFVYVGAILLMTLAVLAELWRK